MSLYSPAKKAFEGDLIKTKGNEVISTGVKKV
jgi:hypothetical protein